MRKRIAGKKLSRSTTSRQALFRSLVRSVVINGKIDTTEAKAKVVLSYMGKLITTAKKNNLSGRRRVLANLAGDNKTVKGIYRLMAKLNNSLPLKFTPLPPRRGDNAKMARLEIMGWVPEEKKEDKKTKNEIKSAEKDPKKEGKTKSKSKK